jgi:hypothetical protein
METRYLNFLCCGMALMFSVTASQVRAQGGIPLWTNRYIGPSPNGGDQPFALAVDSSGHAVVTGTTYTGNSIEFATVAYSKGGVPLWTNRYKGPANDNEPAAATIDSIGNVFVTGTSIQMTNPPYNYDYATVAYSNTGIPLWTNRFNGAANSYDFASAIAVDRSNNVFVTGRSVGSSFVSEYTTIKYSNSGMPLWTNRYAESGNNSAAHAIAVTTNGDVLVTGSYNAASGDVNCATIKYSNGGAPLWTNRYGAPALHESGNSIAVDNAGNAFVTGQADGGSSASIVFFTIAYSPAGAPLWTNLYTGPGAIPSGPFTIAVDSSGRVFVAAGRVTIKYSQAGVPLWTNQFDGVQTEAVAADRKGNVFVTGIAFGTTAAFDYVTVAYANSGTPLWTNRYCGPGNGDNRPAAIAVDSGGDVFVTGISSLGISLYNYRYATIMYSPTVPAPVPLVFQMINSQLVLSWTNPAFSLQSATQLSEPFTDITGAVSPYTNTPAGAQQFFRLISN